LSTVSIPTDSAAMAASRRKSVLLVFACTVLGAAAQIFIKLGMAHFDPAPLVLIRNYQLIAGYTLYGMNTIMLVLALREGELSMLYPIIALTYVWVTLLSYLLLGETPNLFKNVGIAIIVVGVAVLGRGGKKS
jgi:uncharacterized membrane protein